VCVVGVGGWGVGAWPPTPNPQPPIPNPQSPFRPLFKFKYIIFIILLFNYLFNKKY